MKNKYNFSQIAQVYCQEIGVEIPNMENYLIEIFKKKPDIDKIKEYEDAMKNIVTNSEFFPEFWGVVVDEPLGLFEINIRKRKHKH